MRNSIKKTYSILFLLLSVCAYSHASRPGPSEKWASSSSQAHITQELNPDALTHLIIDRDSSGIPIELWEEIILPYVGIEGGLERLCTSKHIPYTPLIGHKRSVCSAQFSHDGTKIVTGSFDRTARIWDAKTSTTLYTLTGHSDWIWNAEFNHDDTQIVTASMDQTARVWNASTGELIHTLGGHTHWVCWAQFNYNDTIIATKSIDGKARTWDAATGLLIEQWRSNTNWDRENNFNHDGSQKVTKENNRTARIWHLPTRKPSLNQMIFLWALEQEKKNQFFLESLFNKKIRLAMITQKYNIPIATLRQLFATFSKHDQTNIEKSFNLDDCQSQKEFCTIQ